MKGMFLNDNTIQAEGVGKFFENLGRSSAKPGKKLSTNVIRNRATVLGNDAKVGSIAMSKIPRAIFSTTPDVKTFYHSGKVLLRAKLVLFKKHTQFYRYMKVH